QQRRHQEEVDGVVLVEVEVEALPRRYVEDDASAVDEALDEAAALEPAEALAEVGVLVALERVREADAARAQERNERVRGTEEVGHPAGGTRRAEQRARAHRRGAADRGL